MIKLKKKVAITRRRKKINKQFWFVPSQQLNKLTMRQLKKYLKMHKCFVCQKIFRFKSGLKTHNEDNHQKLVKSSNKVFGKEKSPLSNKNLFITNENPPSKIEQFGHGKTRDQRKPDDDDNHMSGINSQMIIIPSTSQELQHTQRLLHSAPINVPGGEANGTASYLSTLKRRLQTPTTNRVPMVNPSCSPVAQAWGPWTRGGPGKPHVRRMRGTPEGPHVRGIRGTPKEPHVRGMRGTLEEPHVRGMRPRMRVAQEGPLLRGIRPNTRGAQEGPLMRGVMRGSPRGSKMRGMRGTSRGLLMRGMSGTPGGLLVRGIRPSMVMVPGAPGIQRVKGGVRIRGIRPRMRGTPTGLLMRGMRPRMGGIPKGHLPLIRGIRPSMVMVPGSPWIRGVPGGLPMRGMRPRMRGAPQGLPMRGMRPGMPMDSCPPGMPGVQGGVRMRWDPRTTGGTHVRGMRPTPRMPMGSDAPRISGARLPVIRPGGQMRTIEIVDLGDKESPSPMALTPANPDLDRLKSFGISVSCQKGLKVPSDISLR